MDLIYSPAEEAFRAELREWLADNVPAEPRPEQDLSATRVFDCEWQRRLYDAGYGGVSWPAAFGGRGGTVVEELIFQEELAAAGAPDYGVRFVGLGHAGPTLIARGTPEQQERHLGPILRGEEIWCQGFSEPGAGSDLASLLSKGVVDGDHLVVSGQKIWTSYASVADFQELLVRTDASGRKHHGITWVICDMSSPGIEVRPIRTMTDNFHFCEVFYDDVRIPLTNVVGEVDGGWTVAMATLGFERGTAFISEQIRLGRRVDELVQLQRDKGNGDTDFPRRLAAARVAADAVLAMSYRNVSTSARGENVGIGSSLTKLATVEGLRQVAELGAAVAGADIRRWGNELTFEFAQQFAYVFGGGTPEIQRNLVAERLLGLPRSW